MYYHFDKLDKDTQKKGRKDKDLKEATVKLQALVRGYLTRKKLTKNNYQPSNSTELDYVKDYPFPNGATYTGILY